MTLLNERKPNARSRQGNSQEWRSQHNDSLIERRPAYTQRQRQQRRSSEEWMIQQDDSLTRGSLTTLNPSWGALRSGGLSIPTL